MIRTRWIVIFAAAGLMLTDCDRKQSAKPTESPSPATAAPIALPGNLPGAGGLSTSTPTTIPVALRTLFVIEGETSTDYEFPAAHLYIDREHRELALYTKEADGANNGHPDKSANSYYLPLTTDNFDEFIQQLDAHQLNNFELRPKPSSGEYDDSTFDGINLGEQYRLQASHGVVRIDEEGPALRIRIDGSFFRFDTEDDSQAASVVSVKGTVMAVVDGVP